MMVSTGMLHYKMSLLFKFTFLYEDRRTNSANYL